MCPKKRLAIKHYRQTGLGLPATIFLILIIAIVVLAMGEITEDSSQGFAQDFHSMRAFYAAESGAQIALNRVFVGGTVCNDAMGYVDFDIVNDNPGLNNCVAQLVCRADAVLGTNYMTFTSTATCGAGAEQATRSIQVRAHE